jgi:hypothetical protein
MELKPGLERYGGGVDSRRNAQGIIDLIFRNPMLHQSLLVTFEANFASVDGAHGQTE